MLWLGVFFFQAEDGIRDGRVTEVQTCALPIWVRSASAGSLQVTRLGDVLRAETTLQLTAARTEVVFAYDEGTDVFVRHEPAAAGAESAGLRILRSRADGKALRLTLEGRGGRRYILHVRTPRIPGNAS